MSRREDLSRLKDMLDAARDAVSAASGHNEADIAADRVWALGLVKCIEIVGEAATKISEEIRNRYPDIPWAEIIGMRNRLVHVYFDIDYEQVWKTLTEDMPPLIERLESIFDNEISNE